MKFLKILAVVLMLGLAFMTFGGYMLFDFQNHFWLASVFCGLILALLIYIHLRQDDKIDELKARLDALEKQVKAEDK